MNKVPRPRTSLSWTSAFDLVQWVELQRKAAGMSRRALANVIEVNEYTVKSWGKQRLPRLDHIVACVELFGYKLLPIREPIFSQAEKSVLLPVTDFHAQLAAASYKLPLQQKDPIERTLPGTEGARNLIHWMSINQRTIHTTRYNLEADPITCTVEESRDISDPELARKAGINKAQTIQNWRHGMMPSLEYFMSCVQVLDHDLVPMREPMYISDHHHWPVRQFIGKLKEDIIILEAATRGIEKDKLHEYVDKNDALFERSGKEAPKRRQF